MLRIKIKCIKRSLRQLNRILRLISEKQQIMKIISFQKILHEYLIHTWSNIAFQGNVKDGRATVLVKDYLKLRLQPL